MLLQSLITSESYRRNTSTQSRGSTKEIIERIRQLTAPSRTEETIAPSRIREPIAPSRIREPIAPTPAPVPSRIAPSVNQQLNQQKKERTDVRCCGFCRKPGHFINACKQIQDEMSEVSEFCSAEQNKKNANKTREWLKNKNEKVLERIVYLNKIENNDFPTTIDLLMNYYGIHEMDSTENIPISSIVGVTAESFLPYTVYATAIPTNDTEAYSRPAVCSYKINMI